MSPSASTRVEWARRLAHSIVTDGYATEAEVAPVLNEATDRGSSFPALLISRDVTSQEVVLGLLSQLTRLPVVDLDHDRPSDQALASTPVTVAREYGAVGYRLDGDQLTTAFGDPPDEDDVRALSVLVGHVVVPVLANPLAIERVLASIEPPQAAPLHRRPRPPTANGTVPAPRRRHGRQRRTPGRRATVARAESLHAEPGSRRESRVRAAPRRSAALRRERRRIGPPPHHGPARRASACTAPSGPSRAVPCSTTRSSGTWSSGSSPRRCGSASRPRRSSTPPTRSSTWAASGSTSSSSEEPWRRRCAPSRTRSRPSRCWVFPESIRSFTEMRHGLVLVTGPTGLGQVDHPGVAGRHHQPHQAACTSSPSRTPSSSCTTTSGRW